MVKFLKKKTNFNFRKTIFTKFFKDEIAKPIFNNYQIKTSILFKIL